MKKILLSACLAAALPLGATQAADVVELNLGHVLATDSHYHVVAEKLAEIAAAKSQGTLKINVFPSGQLGGEVKLIQSARTGAVPLVVTGEPPVENTVKEFGVFSLPYLFPDLQKANHAMQSQFGKRMLGYLDKHGLVGLGWISSLERNIYGVRKVEHPDDMKAMKIRVIQSPGYVKAYEALGAQPTPMAYSEVYLALQTGVIDAGEASPDTMIQDKFAEVSKYYNLVKIHYMPAILLMSKARMDKLSPEHQKILREAADEAVKHGIQYYTDGYAKSLEQIKAMGVQIVSPDIAEFREKTAALYPSLLADIPDGEANVKAARAAIE